MVFSNLADVSRHFLRTTKDPVSTQAELKQIINLGMRLSKQNKFYERLHEWGVVKMFLSVTYKLKFAACSK